MKEIVLNGKHYLATETHLIKVLRKGHSRPQPGSSVRWTWNGCWALLPKPKAY